MAAVTQAQFEQAFHTFASGDVDAACNAFADDGRFLDPHYPQLQYRGREEIRGAFRFAWENVLESLRFSVRNFWAGERSCAAEVDVHQKLKDGTEHHVPQMFVMETDGAQITRLQAYTPYPPPRVTG